MTPIRLFRNVSADRLDDAFNSLVNDINARFAAAGGGAEGTVTNRQMRSALSSQAQLSTVVNGISADVSDATNIQWNSGAPVTPGDTLATSIQSITGYNAGQMTALFLLAASQTP